MQPVRTADGRVTVPEEVIESMQRNKIGLKGWLEKEKKMLTSATVGLRIGLGF